MLSLFDEGLCVTFDYPAANYQGVRPRWERRRLLVERVRSLDAEPLSPVTQAIDPHLKRGKTLVVGRDLDKAEKRSFYLESMRDIEVVDPRSITHFLDDVYGNHYSVVWIECDDEWEPTAADLPDEFRITGVMVNSVSRFFAETIADKANQECELLARRGRWTIVLPPGAAADSCISRSGT